MKRSAQASERWVAGYPRVSTDIQMERDSLTNQVQALEAYGSSRGSALKLYREEGVSAKDTERPALQRLIADVRAGRVEAVVVSKLDRISRSLHDLLDLMALFEAHGVNFISLRDNIDTSGPVGRFMLHILGAIAELERGITAERVAEDMKLRAQRGKWNGGLAPYARQVEDGQLTIVPDEADVLCRMRTLLLDKRTWRGVGDRAEPGKDCERAAGSRWSARAALPAAVTRPRSGHRGRSNESCCSLLMKARSSITAGARRAAATCHARLTSM